MLFKEASLMGDVQFVMFPECPGRDEALVTFASFGYGALTVFVLLPNRNHREIESTLVVSSDQLLTAFPAVRSASGLALWSHHSLHAPHQCIIVVRALCFTEVCMLAAYTSATKELEHTIFTSICTGNVCGAEHRIFVELYRADTVPTAHSSCVL